MRTEQEQLRILVVDDDEDDFFIVRRLIAKAAPAEVDWGQSYEEGLAAVTTIAAPGVTR